MVDLCLFLVEQVRPAAHDFGGEGWPVGAGNCCPVAPARSISFEGDMCVCELSHLHCRWWMHQWLLSNEVGFFHGAPSIHTCRVARNADDWSLTQDGMKNMRLLSGCSACQKPLAASCAAASCTHTSASALPKSTLVCWWGWRCVKPRGSARDLIACCGKRFTAMEKELQGGPMCRRATRPSNRRPMTTARKSGLRRS